MKDLGKRVPMHTWLAALPQLISRMCHPCKDVSELARQIIIRITQVRSFLVTCIWLHCPMWMGHVWEAKEGGMLAAARHQCQTPHVGG